MIDDKKELEELKELKEKLFTEISKAKLIDNVDKLNGRLLSVEDTLNKIEQSLEKDINNPTVSNYVLQVRKELSYAYDIVSKFAGACENIYDIAILIHNKQSNNKRSRKNSS